MAKKIRKLSLLVITLVFSLVLSSCAFFDNIFNFFFGNVG